MIQTTPFAANYGYHPKADYLVKTLPETNVPTAQTNIQNLQKIHAALDSMLKDAASTFKKYADVKRTDHSFKVGDLVWLLRKHMPTARPTTKLDHRKIGPFKITKQINRVAFELNLPSNMKIHPVFHVSLFEKHVASKIPSRTAPPPPPTIINNSLEYEVDKILDSRLYYGKLQYLIQWKGFNTSENSWEPLINLEHAKDSVHAFHAQNPSRPSLDPQHTCIHGTHTSKGR